MFLGALALGDVADDQAGARLAVVVTEGGAGEIHRHQAAVLAAQPQFAVRRAGVVALVQQRLRARIGPVHDVVAPKRAQFLFAIVQQLAGCIVGGQDGAPGSGQEYRVDAVFEHCAVARFAFAQRLCQRALFGDVFVQRYGAEHIAVAGQNRRGRIDDGLAAAVAGLDVDDLVYRGFPLGERSCQSPVGPL